MDAGSTTVPSLIREWRGRRRKSQLDLALDAGISQRHLSFLESGRSSPSREMVLRLAECLEVPLRQRNRMLVAAGFAPVYGERRLDDPGLESALTAVRQVLKAQEPFPAIAVDNDWNMLLANDAIGPFLQGIEDPSLLSPPVNVLRLALHPRGMAPRIENLDQWRQHLLERLRSQIDASPTDALVALERELSSYPGRRRGPVAPFDPAAAAVAVPLRIRMGPETLTFISTITVFGTPLDVTLSELAIESFFPADEQTRFALQRLGAGQA